MKTYKLTEDEFVTLMSYHLRLKNNAIKNLQYSTDNNHAKELINYYQREIDTLNEFADRMNEKFKTNFLIYI